MPVQPPMKAGPRKLSEVARHLVLPSGITSTGWPAVRDKAAEMGITYDLWQDGLGRAMLAKRADGTYAAGIGGVVISICRQVGKTFTVGTMIVMLCILFPGLKVLWTAHRTRTSDETFKSLQGIVKRKALAPHVADVRRANGQQEIEFVNGSRIMFGARETGFGRGFDDVDVLVFDEGQILSQKSLDDMVPSTNVSPNPLILFMGTPPKPTDPSEAFTAMRESALSGKSDDLLYVEVSADPDADPEDREQWARANPSYPHRTREAAILRMRKILNDLDSFLREGLGIWDDPRSAGVIPGGKWADAHADEETLRNPAVAVDLRTGARQALAIGVASIRSDGIDDLDLAVYELGADEKWARDYAVSEVQRILAAHNIDLVTVDQYGDGNGLLITQLEEAGVKVRKLNSSDMRNGAVGLVNAIVNGLVKHHNDESLNAAVAGAVKRKSGDGFLWDQSRATADLTPLRSLTAAWWSLQVDRTVDYDVSKSYF